MTQSSHTSPCLPAADAPQDGDLDEDSLAATLKKQELEAQLIQQQKDVAIAMILAAITEGMPE